MASARRQGQYTRRMDSGRGSICRHFMNGFCRFGRSCHYRHERPVTPSGQLCRYFQKGRCWYGEHCRYLHVLQSEVYSAVADRRSSVPTVSSSSVAYAPSDRRGSEPALLQSETTSRHECGRSEFVVNLASPEHSTGCLGADNAEEQSQDADSDFTASWESTQSSEVAQAFVSDGGLEPETSSDETTKDGATAAASTASGTQESIEETEALLQSKNVTCGICMEKVYEKPHPRNRVFGILPNCNHPYCVHCIKTWRKTKDLRMEAVKSCPHCRIRSPFYVPSKYWVEGPAKESMIAAFKEKFRKKSCSYYLQYRCCPFNTECLYRHDNHRCQRSFPYPSEDEDDYDASSLYGLLPPRWVIAMTHLSGNGYQGDDDFNSSF